MWYPTFPQLLLRASAPICITAPRLSPTRMATKCLFPQLDFNEEPISTEEIQAAIQVMLTLLPSPMDQIPYLVFKG